MPNANYLKGRSREYSYRNELYAEGYDTVRRTRGSHSPDDLIATHQDECLHVQLKATVNKITPRSFATEIEEFKKYKLPISCFKRFVAYTSHKGQRGWHVLYKDY